MEKNIPTGRDILRDIAIQYVNKAFVYITDCNPPLKTANTLRPFCPVVHELVTSRKTLFLFVWEKTQISFLIANF